MLRRNATFLVIAALTLGSAIAVGLLRGMGAVRHALGATWDLLLTVLPSILGGLLLSAALRQLVPPGALARWMGAESGLRGLVVATAAGMAMPGGPVAAFPVVLVLAQAGADRGALIAFVLAWSLNGFQRILVWELPILGADFALLRLICGLALPVLAGLVARWLPIQWVPADAPGMKDGPRPVSYGQIAIWLVALFALGLCTRRSPALGARVVRETGVTLVRVLPVMLLALPMAAFVSELVPNGFAEAWLGPNSGPFGILLASLAGGLMPGGPFVAFPLVLGFLKSGAGPAQMVALISGWAILGMHRTLAWELPILGPRFVALRLAASFVLPLLAGLMAQLLLPLFPHLAPG